VSAHVESPPGSHPVDAVSSVAVPDISVLITTYNRSDLLELCLQSLDRQSARPESYEVVVVVDGSTDDTLEMLGRLTLRCALTVVAQEQSGSTAGRNAGAARARGRLLLFVDDDELADPGLVAAHLEAHRRHPATVVLGAIERRVPENGDRLARLGCEDAAWQNEELTRRPATFWDCYGGNCSCTREAYRAVGGYAVDLRRESDTELGYRLHAAGQGFVFASDAIVSEYRDRPWRGIIEDTRLRGGVAVAFYERHPEMLPQMPLGGSAELSTGRGRQALGALLLALRLPPSVVAAVGLVLPGRRLWKPWYALALRHAYWSGVRGAADGQLWRQARSATLILGYHAFGEPGERPSRYVVPARRLERQLAWLKRRRYNVITLGEYLEYRANYRFPPPKTVVLTIDDGYLDNATVARPLLERFGLSATLFLTSSPRAARDPGRDPALAGRALIDPAKARELLGERFEIGSHTRTHPDLTAITRDEAWHEIAGSRTELEACLGTHVAAFAYPFGALNPEIRVLVEQAGYRAARGTRPGRNRPATPAFDLRWLEIRGTYSLPRFAATLAFGELRGLGALFGGRRGRARHAAVRG
jgi:peptidoglycan/xylan/chitin deacetylase (PgdA/CDA1 family)